MATVNEAVMREETVTSVGGLRIFGRLWQPQAPRGVVVILPRLQLSQLISP